jgi:hypothetical protein
MATVQSWIDIANRAWFDLWKTLPPEQQKDVPRMPPGTGLSTNAMDSSLKKDPDLIASGKAWADGAWKDWNESGRSAPVPVLDAAVTHEALGLDSRMSLAELTGYSAGFVAVSAAKLKRGGSHAFIKNEGDPNAFAFGEQDSVQRERFLETARGHGGDHVAVWTFGHAIHVLVARSPKPGERLALHGPFSVRLRVAAGTQRPGGFVESLMNALSESSIHPDFESLHREIARPELSVSRCFEAFGLPGARDLDSPDAAARWKDMNRVGHALLTAQPVDKKQLKNVQELLEPLSNSAKLPSKGKLGKGETARVVADAAVDLRRALGISEAGAWTNRFRSASFYWDICEGAALDRLTTGADRAGIGTGSSVARLLAHFPNDLLRDPLFLSLLALECEAANGHSFVEALSKLAEQTATAGLVLVVALKNQHSSMRKAFGITPEVDGAGPDGVWCGEALISDTTITKGDLMQTARNWMAKATGALAQLSADGVAKVEWYKEGSSAGNPKEVGLKDFDDAALRDAGKRFLPRDGFVALGVGDLLAPGEWSVGSHSGNSGSDHRMKKRIQAEAVLNTAVEPSPLKNFGELFTALGRNVRYKGELKEDEGGFVSLRVISPTNDEVWLRDLRNDLKGRSLIANYGDVWVQDAEIRGYTCSDLDVALLIQLLADAASGTSLSVGLGREMIGAWRIA